MAQKRDAGGKVENVWLNREMGGYAEGWVAKLVAHLPVTTGSLGSNSDIPQKS